MPIGRKSGKKVTGATSALAGQGNPREVPMHVMGKKGQRRRGTAQAARGC